MKPLNAKQLRFVELYQQTLARGKPNGAQSYIEAYPGCGQKTAEANASRLLRDARVQQLLAPVQQQVEVARQQTLTSIEITRDRIRLEMARLSFVNPKNLFHPDGTRKGLHELDDDTAAALAQFEVEEEVDGDTATVLRTTKVKFWDKNRALQSLADTEPGVWVDPKTPPGGTTNVNMTFNLASLSDDDLDRLESIVERATHPEPVRVLPAAEPGGGAGGEGAAAAQ